MKYYAMIDGRQQGPFELAELHAAGVLPDTYVWCKTMDDWEKAEDVAEICRFYRQRIFYLMHPDPEPAPTQQVPPGDQYQEFPMRFRNYARQAGADPFLNISEEDFSREPRSMIAPALVTLFLCFPITGIVALYYAILSRKAWKDAERGNADHNKDLYSNEEIKEYARKAHDYARKAKMWVGITFFFGFIFTAFLSQLISR